MIVAFSNGSGSGGVWVSGFEFLEVGLEEFESVGLPSTGASVGSGIAGNDFLFGKGEEFTGLDEVSTFNSAGG